MPARKKSGGRAKRQPKGDYKNGYCRPPKDKQFKPGVSGNPKGRPKGSKNIATELEEVLAELIEARTGDKVAKATLRRTMIKTHALKAAKGDVRSLNAILNMLIRSGRFGDATEDALQEDVSETDAAIIDDFLRRKASGSSGCSED